MCEKNDIRIVLADDSLVVRRELSRVFTRMGFDVVGLAADGVEAVHAVKQLNPDLLILDIEMPRMNGITVTKKLRESRSPVKILILSNYTDRVFMEELLKLGVDGYITKEDPPAELEAAVCAIAQENRNWFSEKIYQ